MSTLRKREGAIESRERVVAQGNANLQTQREELGAREDWRYADMRESHGRCQLLEPTDLAKIRVRGTQWFSSF